PKENGALIIVIWNAVILHARWGGMVKTRGLMALAIFGNVVTAWSWFGVNMLGVGLHSYGFMDSAFWWLIAFVASQLAVIALCALPPEKWGSFEAKPTRG
ncbi:MAG: cytochrome C biogenesis protein, partial [Verrucomicrobia bacterium]|nr:cytochrome C biogenesis protein [Verrucomicrobiota bacterium]